MSWGEDDLSVSQASTGDGPGSWERGTVKQQRVPSARGQRPGGQWQQSSPEVTESGRRDVPTIESPFRFRTGTGFTGSQKHQGTQKGFKKGEKNV